MSRLACLRAFTAASLLALALPADAAEATRVASSGDEDNPFDLDFSIKADYVQDRALITREYTRDYQSATPLSTVQERPELRYLRRTFAIMPRMAVGIWKDLEAHVEVPIVLSANTKWHYANYQGQSAGPYSATFNNSIGPDGSACKLGATCPIFPGDGTVFHGAGLGDLKLGVAWGILSDARDDTKPFWLVGVDFIFPTSKMYDPGLDRAGALNVSPYSDAAKSGPFGENVFKIDLVTALSKRMGTADPYVKFHVTSYRPSAQTYSDCMHAQALKDLDESQVTQAFVDECKLNPTSRTLGARPPYVVGAAFGAEVVTGENKAEGTRVAIDMRLSADYTSTARWYNELTDMTGKLMKTEDYFSVKAFFGFYWRASKFMQLQATAHLGTETPHFLTGESEGPNFDARYDGAGTRYRITEVSDFGLALAGLLQF